MKYKKPSKIIHVHITLPDYLVTWLDSTSTAYGRSAKIRKILELYSEATKEAKQ